MKIRIVNDSDKPQLKQIRRRICSIGLEDDHIAHRLAAQSREEAAYLVVEDNDELVAFWSLKFKGKATHPDYPDIEDLFTRLDKRKKGYATALLLECEKRAKARGFQKIGLAAGPDPTDPGHQLYVKLGYRYDGKESYVDGVYDGIEDWVIDMEKNLPND